MAKKPTKRKPGETTAQAPKGPKKKTQAGRKSVPLAKLQAKTRPAGAIAKQAALGPVALPATGAEDARVLDRLWSTIISRRTADPVTSHSARLLSRGMPKVAQKFGEEAVECLIEAVGRNREPLIAESADVLYHLLVMWVAAGVRPEDVWAELRRREGMSGIAEKAQRPALMAIAATSKIP